MMNENNGIENIARNIAKKKILLFLFGGGCGTTFWIFMVGFPVFIAILVVLGLLNGSNSGNGVCHNYKSVDEICKQMVVNGQSMSVDEYVAHVITNEFGSAPDETLKAQAVASRSYGLNGASKDGNGNCIISDTSEGFQTYAKNYTDRAMQAAMDTSGVILVDENGAVARSEYSSNSLPKPYSSFGNTITMSERDLEIPRDWFSKNKTCSDSDLNKANKNKDAYGRTVYGCGHGRGMGQIAAKYLDTEKGYNYEQILEFFYGKDSKYNWSLASTNGSVTNSNCGSSSNGDFQALSSYNIGHKNLKILSSPLSSSQVTDLNSYINTEVDKAGYGTGAGVAAAGQSLVYGLEQLGYYLGYCWGGDRTSVGVGTKWGTKSSGCNSPDNVHQYYGMDCSGFVSWAIRNGCTNSFGGPTTYDMEYGPHIDVKKAKPGDLMLDTDSHVRLVIKNNGDGTVIVAEEGGNYGDLGFSKVSNEAGYNFIDMSSFYSKTCKSTNPATGNKRGSVSSSSSSNSSSSSSSTSDGSLKSQINSYISSSAASGTWSVYVKNLKTNKVVDINASKKMNSASSIKLFVLASAYDKAKSGSVAEASFKANARNMIVYSDNSATNNVIDTIGGMGVVNSYVGKNGYSSTTLNRKFGGSYTSSGVNNYTSARDTGVLLEKIYNGSLVSSSYSKTMLDFLKNQNTRSKIPAGVSSGTVANKTGEIPDQGIENDSAIVYTIGADYVISVMSNTSNYSKAITDIAKISNIVYKYYNK